MRMSWCEKNCNFRDDVFGGITAFTLMVFVVMFVSVGMAIDFMRYETYRAELQDAVDRGILAAASTGLDSDSESIVQGYLKTTRFVSDDYNLVVPEPTINSGARTFEATVDYDVNTFFLKMIGIDTMPISARGMAMEGVSKMELSLVLDISTSMVIFDSGSTGQTRLEVLQQSANNFIDSVFETNGNDRLSMSIVPFAGAVNIGPTALDYLNNNRIHNYSNCVEFNSSDMAYVANADGDSSADPYNSMLTMPSSDSLVQMQQFNFSKYQDSSGYYTLYGPDGIDDVGFGWCPTDSQAITYHETNKDLLKARIDNLETHEGTGTHYGAKWGAMLLDPSAQNLVDEVSGTNADVLDEDGGVAIVSEPVEETTPASYGNGLEVKKYLVIMSDGDTSTQVRLKDNRYDTQAEIDYWSDNLSGNQSNDFTRAGLDGQPITSGPTVEGGWTNSATTAAREAARIAFRNTCETAKDNGIVVFTIGFDLTADSAAEDDLAACATSGYFYNVTGAALADAFESISATIQKLRLVY